VGKPARRARAACSLIGGETNEQSASRGSQTQDVVVLVESTGNSLGVQGKGG